MAIEPIGNLIEKRRLECGYDPVPPEPMKIGQTSRPLTDAEIDERAKRADEDERRRETDRRMAAVAAVFKGRDRYANCTVDGFQCTCANQRAAVERLKVYGRNITQMVSDGCGLVLLGPAGTGKDHLMAALLKRAASQGFHVAWRNGMDLFGEFRDRIGDERTEGSLIDSLIRPDVLGLSDPLPPFGELTTFQSAMLFRVIDGRYSARRPTWVTINVASAAEAEKRIGVQTIQRLEDNAVVVLCNWESYRKPRTGAEA
jgi:DNA replication protein DnaC